MKAILWFCLAFLVLPNAQVLADQGEEPVGVSLANFVRAETDHMIRTNMDLMGVDFGKITHIREPATPDKQPIIRMNQDTLYSSTVLDLTKPVTITLPEVGERYISLQVINQDHYMSVATGAGSYEFTKAKVGSRYAFVIIRIFYNVAEPQDLALAHAAQDKITISGGGMGPFEAPNWDTSELEMARQALSRLASLGFESFYAFGGKDDVKPIDHLVGAAAGWGGLPAANALYLIESVDENDGLTPHVVVLKEMPVNAFWSITVYNEEGYLEANELGRNSLNSYSAKPDEDGSITIHFGGEQDLINHLPIPKNWNYAVRLYEPKDEILDGSWSFPDILPLP